MGRRQAILASKNHVMILSMMGLGMPTSIPALQEQSELELGEISSIIKDLQAFSLVRTLPGGYVRIPRNWGNVEEHVYSLDEEGEPKPHVFKNEWWMKKKSTFAAKKRGIGINDILRREKVSSEVEYYEVINILKDNHKFRFDLIRIPANVSGNIINDHQLFEIDGWICWSWRK